MRRITVIDAIIIAILLFSLYSFVSRESTVYSQVDEYYYTGSQIYKATSYMDFLDSKGFLYDTYVRGYWWSDYLAFDETGYVIEAGNGSFSLLRDNGEVVTIGGRMSYREQVGASEIRLIIKTKSVVTMRMYSGTYASFGAYSDTVMGACAFLGKFAIDDIAITGTISWDADVSPSKIAEAELEDLIRKSLHYVKGIDVELAEGGGSVTITQGSIDELSSIPALLGEHGMGESPVFVSDATVIVRTGEEIGELDKYGIKQHISDHLAGIFDADGNAIHIRL